MELLVRRSGIVLALVLVGSIALSVAQSVFAAEEPRVNWLTETNFVLEKTADLDSNATPVSFGIDCEPTTYRLGTTNTGQERSGCAVQTPIGLMHNGYVLNGTYGTLPLNYVGHDGMIAPAIPNSSQVIMRLNAGGILKGEYFKVSTYDPSLFVYRQYSGLPPKLTYEYRPMSGTTLTSSSGTVLVFLHNSLAYSANGQWLTAVDTKKGIWRFDTQTWQGKLVGWLSSEFTMNSQTGGTNLAISDDGRYIAVNDATLFGSALKPALKVYDTTSCEDLAQYYRSPSSGSDEQCEHNDIWNGTRQGSPYVKTIDFSGMEAPRHIRFSGDDAITFSVVYDRISTSEFRAASYKISILQAEESSLELLALGDSYISGEGAFQYREGTDTSSNKCHNSLKAYPQLLGARLTASYNSVACSGAVTEDIFNNADRYVNQLIPQVQQNTLSEEIKADALSMFKPGYINQLQFIGEHKPSKALLSIGGNDIHFADIISLCVLSNDTDSCFDTTTERKALLQLVYDQHDTLKRTYQDIVAANPETDLYVVGYPQIAKVSSSCGLNVSLDAEEVEFGALLIARLNQAIRNAAESTGVRYVDIERSLYGSRLCENGIAGVNGLAMGGDKYKLLGNESYHPTAYGHTLIANTISRQTSDLTQAMPTATGTGKLTLDDQDIFIRGANNVGKTLRKLIFGGLTDHIVNIPFHKERIKFDTEVLNISTGTAYRLVFHSTEVEVAQGIVPTDGVIDIDITVPSIEEGAHTLHLYTKDSEGTDLDIMQVVYVAASDTDYDGDGISNDVDSCSLVKNSGIDTDGDGIDDVCDGDSAVLASTLTQKDTETSQDPQAKEASANIVEQNDITYSGSSSTTPEARSGVVLASQQASPGDTGDVTTGAVERTTSTEESSSGTQTIIIGAIIAVLIIFGLVYVYILVRG